MVHGKREDTGVSFPHGGSELVGEVPLHSVTCSWVGEERPRNPEAPIAELLNSGIGSMGPQAVANLALADIEHPPVISPDDINAIAVTYGAEIHIGQPAPAIAIVALLPFDLHCATDNHCVTPRGLTSEVVPRHYPENMFPSSRLNPRPRAWDPVIGAPSGGAPAVLP